MQVLYMYKCMCVHGAFILGHFKLYLSFWSSRPHGEFESKLMRTINITTGA